MNDDRNGYRPREIWSTSEARRTAMAGIWLLVAAVPAGALFHPTIGAFVAAAGAVCLVIAGIIAVAGRGREQHTATARTQGQRGHATILDIKVHRPGRGIPTVTARLRIQVEGWQPYETTIRQTVPRFGAVAIPEQGSTITVYVDPARPDDVVPVWP